MCGRFCHGSLSNIWYVLAQRCAEVVKPGRAGELESIASSIEGIEAEFELVLAILEVGKVKSV